MSALGMATRSALVRAAESGLRREQRRNDSAAIVAVCALVIGAYLLAQFVTQALA